MSSGHSVIIVGGTGGLGQYISEAFLAEFRSSFPVVKVLSRNPDSAKAEELKDQGAEVIKLDEDKLAQVLDSAFAGIDVVVNALPSSASDAVKKGVIEALARSSSKVYFPSEYGSDYRVHESAGFDHPIWSEKQELATQARSVAKGKKVICLYTSLFTETALSAVSAGDQFSPLSSDNSQPLFGFDLEHNTYTIYGSPSQKVSLTSIKDIGRAIARISVLSLDPATAAKIPDHIRIASDTLTIENIRDTVARVKGIEKGKIIQGDLGKLQASIRENPREIWRDYILAVIGEGKADFSAQNDNELINPGERVWKWKTTEEHLRSL